MKQFCPECRNEVEVKLSREMKTRNVEGEDFTYRTIISRCSNCGEEISVPEIDDTDSEIYELAYRLEKGLKVRQGLIRGKNEQGDEC